VRLYEGPRRHKKDATFTETTREKEGHQGEGSGLREEKREINWTSPESWSRCVLEGKLMWDLGGLSAVGSFIRKCELKCEKKSCDSKPEEGWRL